MRSYTPSQNARERSGEVVHRSPSRDASLNRRDHRARLRLERRRRDSRSCPASRTIRANSSGNDGAGCTSVSPASKNTAPEPHRGDDRARLAKVGPEPLDLLVRGRLECRRCRAARRRARPSPPAASGRPCARATSRLGHTAGDEPGDAPSVDAATTTTTGTCRAAPRLDQKRGVDDDHVVGVGEGGDRLGDAPPDLRVHDRLEVVARPVVGEHDRGERLDDRGCRRAPATPSPNRSTTASNPSCRARPRRARARRRRARPRRALASMRATVDLPEPMPPVSPTSSTSHRPAGRGARYSERPSRRFRSSRMASSETSSSAGVLGDLGLGGLVRGLRRRRPRPRRRSHRRRPASARGSALRRSVGSVDGLGDLGGGTWVVAAPARPPRARLRLGRDRRLREPVGLRRGDGLRASRRVGLGDRGQDVVGDLDRRRPSRARGSRRASGSALISGSRGGAADTWRIDRLTRRARDVDVDHLRPAPRRPPTAPTRACRRARARSRRCARGPRCPVRRARTRRTARAS